MKHTTNYESEVRRQKNELLARQQKIFKVLKWFLFIPIIFLIFGCFFIVDAGERAVLLTFGQPSITSYEPGIHFKIPIAQKAIRMEIRSLKYESDASSASKDLQIVTTQIAVNYHLEPTQIPTIYKQLGPNYQNTIIQPLNQETIKSVTAKFTAEELITRRQDVKEEIKQMLKEKLLERDIIVEEVSITNFDFSASFNEAIEAKVTAEQQKLKADMDLQRIKVEAEQTIASAKAEAESLRLQKQEITPDLIALRQIEVQRAALEIWDGKLPIVVGGATPFIDISNFI